MSSFERERIERERIEQELQVARSIQQASLPKEVPEPEGWEITPYYQPAREVGGDFYGFHHLSEGRVGLVVGMLRARGYLQRWLCPQPAACCSPPLEPWALPRLVRYWPRSTRRW